MEQDVGNIINRSHNAKIGKAVVSNFQHNEHAAAFIAAYKQAEKFLQVPESEKKEKQDQQKKRGRNLNKKDYENKDEIDEVLEEIDKRLNRLLALVKKEGENEQRK